MPQTGSTMLTGTESGDGFQYCWVRPAFANCNRDAREMKREGKRREKCQGNNRDAHSMHSDEMR